ncbi:MAG TPA: ATP-binding protein [Gemmatimonadaceae bacterium]|nr:ATP-binding protein [Gemmatimonadaceae bacterium]
MSPTSSASVTADDLRRIQIFADLGDDDLAWMAERCDQVVLEPGDVLFEAGTPADWMLMTVEGMLEARRSSADANPFVLHAGEVSGMVPFSRMTAYPSVARAVTRARVARLHKREFGEMLRRIPALEPRLVALLTDRVRDSTRRDEQYEKLTALGKLSAGLAHELNNPASAARRSAAELHGRLDALARHGMALAAEGPDAAVTIRALDALRRRVLETAPPDHAALDALERSDREDVLARWLERAGLEEPWVAAGTFVAAGLTCDDLEAAGAGGCPAALGWLEAAIAADALARTVEASTQRIADLVGAVKAYTHMDQGRDRRPVDVHAGLESTIAIFAHKVREKKVALERDFARGLPPVSAYPGELNQVWTNLLDNALDAAPPGGHVVVRTSRENGTVAVEIRDDGPGIPPAVLSRIWEPFFTTKPVGQGTGLGLDIARRIIVQQHGGAIDVESRPGETRFIVRLPL